MTDQPQDQPPAFDPAQGELGQAMSLDWRILEYLRQHSKAGVFDISAELDESPDDIAEVLHRLEAESKVRQESW